MGEAGELVDVGEPGGQADDPTPVAADEERDVGLGRPDAQRLDRDVVELALERRRVGVQQAAQHLEGLTEATHPRPRLVDRQPHGVVLGLRVPGPEAEHEATAGHRVDRRGRAGEQHRVVQLVVQHERTDPHRRRGRCGGHHRHERIDGAEVVVGVQLLVAEGSGLLGVPGDRRRVARGRASGGRSGTVRPPRRWYASMGG